MTRMREPSRRTAVLTGLAALVIAAAAIISIAVLSQSALTVGRASQAAANARFEAVRRRFGDAQPLLKIVTADDRARMVVHRERLPATTGSTSTIRGLAWRASGESLAEVRLPFWFVRMKLAGGSAGLGALLPDGWDVVSVSADDLARHGPGLLLDERRANGDCLLLWAE